MKSIENGEVCAQQLGYHIILLPTTVSTTIYVNQFSFLRGHKLKTMHIPPQVPKSHHFVVVVVYMRDLLIHTVRSPTMS